MTGESLADNPWYLYDIKGVGTILMSFGDDLISIKSRLADGEAYDTCVQRIDECYDRIKGRYDEIDLDAITEEDVPVDIMREFSDNLDEFGTNWRKIKVFLNSLHPDYSLECINDGIDIVDKMGLLSVKFANSEGYKKSELRRIFENEA